MSRRKMNLNRRDVFLLLGIASITGGVSIQFSPAWGAIVAGVFLFAFGWLGGET